MPCQLLWAGRPTWMGKLFPQRHCDHISQSCTQPVLSDAERCGNQVTSPSLLLENALEWQSEKGTVCWSYQWVEVSVVITFMAHDISECCKEVQLTTEILADNNEWMGICVKAAEETAEQRLKQWHILITKQQWSWEMCPSPTHLKASALLSPEQMACHGKPLQAPSDFSQTTCARVFWCTFPLMQDRALSLLY